MELLIKQAEHIQTEKPCEECTPKTEKEEKIDTADYDYNKRLWF